MRHSTVLDLTPKLTITRPSARPNSLAYSRPVWSQLWNTLGPAIYARGTAQSEEWVGASERLHLLLVARTSSSLPLRHRQALISRQLRPSHEICGRSDLQH